MKWRIVGLLACAALGAACSNNDTTTTAPSTPTSPVTEKLEGSMAPNGTAIRTFTATQSGTVSVTLASTTPASAIVGLGVGIRAATGADCKFSQTVNTPAGTAPQLTGTFGPGLFCVRVYDVGNLFGAAAFKATIAHS